MMMTAMLMVVASFVFLQGADASQLDGSGPGAAYRLRVDGANTHKESGSVGTKFAIAHDAMPTFTWAAKHGERGATQAGFELVVVDAVTGATVHESGLQETDQPYYQLATPLPAGREFEWSVEWRDQAGRTSPRSEPATFRTAIDDPTWIGVPWIGSNTTNVYRTEVSFAADADETLAAATLYICALGYGKVSVNGKPATDEGLMTISGWTNNERMNYFETYDLTAHMREASLAHGGSMALGVSLGHGWRDQSKFPRKDLKEQLAKGDEIDKVFRAVLTTTSVDGTVTVLTSTAAPVWSAAAGPVTSDGTYDGETYDARMEMPGWDVAGFAEDDAWGPAPIITDGPRGKMVASSMPPVALDRVVKPIGITNPAPGTFIVDYGTNVAGWSVIKNMKGKAGQTVVLKHAEIMQHENLPGNQGQWRPPIKTMNSSKIYQGNLRSALATDTYIMKGDAAGETYHPSFTYHGCRYVEVTGLDSLTVDDIEYHHFHTANAAKAKTTFSSATVTAIQKMSLGAQRSNMMTVPTDCDQRDERLGWMGDADLSAEAMLINYDCGAFLQMFMKNMESEINPDGSLTDVVPFVRYGSRPGDPSWTAAFIEVAYQLWKQEGKAAIPKMYWDKIMLHLSKFAEMAKGAASKWPPTEYGDWVPPPFPKGKQIAGGPKPDREMTSAHAWMGNIQSVIEMATAIGEGPTASSLKATLAKLTTQFNDEWLHPNGTYGNNVQSTYSLPLSLGIVPADVKTQVEDNMVKNVDDKLPVPEGCGHWPGHITTGIIGGKYLFEALAEAGHKDVALKVLETTDYPGFGFMFSNTMEPATENLWELMDAPYEGVGMNSRNHHMWSSVSTYLVKKLAGLDQATESAGYKHLILTPGDMPGEEQRGGMSAASATLALARGDASIDWQWIGGTHCVTAADGSDMQINCGDNGGVIETVEFASYGQPGGQCGAFVANSGCDHKNATKHVQAACLGRTSCTVPVAAHNFGTSQQESCAPAGHAQRVHAQVVCSSPAKLKVSADVPVGSVAHVVIPQPAKHHAQLSMIENSSTTVLWSQASGLANEPNSAGVSGVEQDQDGALKVAVGSGHYDLLLE